jgi:hypothetical protein
MVSLIFLQQKNAGRRFGGVDLAVSVASCIAISTIHSLHNNLSLPGFDFLSICALVLISCGADKFPQTFPIFRNQHNNDNG